MGRGAGGGDAVSRGAGDGETRAGDAGGGEKTAVTGGAGPSAGTAANGAGVGVGPKGMPAAVRAAATFISEGGGGPRDVGGGASWDAIPRAGLDTGTGGGGGSPGGGLAGGGREAGGGTGGGPDNAGGGNEITRGGLDRGGDDGGGVNEGFVRAAGPGPTMPVIGSAPTCAQFLQDDWGSFILPLCGDQSEITNSRPLLYCQFQQASFQARAN